MKTVLITGASRGIGREIALSFWQAGHRVVFNYNKSELQALALAEACNQSRPESALALQGDVGDSTAVERMFTEIEARFGMVEILVNNAGIAQQKLFTDLTDQDWRRMFATHVDGTFFCCRRAAPEMIRKKAGRIINIASMWGEIGGSCEVHYSAAKAAVIGFTKALAKELGLSGITVNCVSPGVIDTEMNNNLTSEDKNALLEEIPVGFLGTAQDVAATVLYLASPEARFLTGQIIGINGGMVV